MCDRHVSGLGAVIQNLFRSGEEAQNEAPSSAKPDKVPDRVRRPKLWKLDDKLHCPVVGTCLSIEACVARTKRKRNPGNHRPRNNGFHYILSGLCSLKQHCQESSWST
jgi:hypothetical protein